uniref:Spi family protease inhibitor n=1 Tax=Porphyromonas loveana TaxID=1884669 RepID=UPI0035A06CD2
MKRFFLALGLLLCSIIVLGAAPVTQTQAERAAQNFFAKRQPHSYLSASTCRMDFVYRTADNGQALFYVFNRGANEGFVLVSADDRFPAVIGYAFEGRF